MFEKYTNVNPTKDRTERINDFEVEEIDGQKVAIRYLGKNKKCCFVPSSISFINKGCFYRDNEIEEVFF